MQTLEPLQHLAFSSVVRFRFPAGECRKAAELGHAVAQYNLALLYLDGPFVMNSRDEIEQAMRDYRDGKLMRAKAAMNAVG